ncbi:hypothetical protein PG994_013059 [Apiospora phragmitis]|uniref:HNH nuclease domain-containing protein n=1 Tax=Apiospora phragmitis TaxID=2905665 RepID=A0ABR1T978_9PEZI
MGRECLIQRHQPATISRDALGDGNPDFLVGCPDEKAYCQWDLPRNTLDFNLVCKFTINRRNQNILTHYYLHYLFLHEPTPLLDTPATTAHHRLAKIDTPPISSPFYKNEALPAPGNEIPPADAPRYRRKQFAAAEHVKQKLGVLINTPRAPGTKRAPLAREEVNLRTLLAFLQCPDAEIEGLHFILEFPHMYDAAQVEEPLHILSDNATTIEHAKHLKKLWQGHFTRMFGAQGKKVIETDLGCEDDETSAMTSDKGKGKEKPTHDIAGPSSTPKKRKPVQIQATADLQTELKHRASARDKDTLAAQEHVPESYGKKCTFTHTMQSIDGTHIIANHLSSKTDSRRVVAFHQALVSFFPPEVTSRIFELLSGSPTCNILPLETGLHRAWGGFHLVIRPMPLEQDEEDDGKTLKLQFLRFNPEDPLHSKCIYEVRGPDEDAAKSGMVDWERGEEKLADVTIQTGDVYIIRTSDPKEHPLSCRDFLNLQYHLHVILHALKARGALESIFRGPPPDIDGDMLRSWDLQELEEPDRSFSFWELIVIFAIRQKVISRDDGWKWLIALENLDQTLEAEPEDQEDELS